MFERLKGQIVKVTGEPIGPLWKANDEDDDD